MNAAYVPEDMQEGEMSISECSFCSEVRTLRAW